MEFLGLYLLTSACFAGLLYSTIVVFVYTTGVMMMI